MFINICGSGPTLENKNNPAPGRQDDAICKLTRTICVTSLLNAILILERDGDALPTTGD